MMQGTWREHAIVLVFLIGNFLLDAEDGGRQCFRLPSSPLLSLLP